VVVLAGWVLAHRSPALAGYATLVAIGFHLRVVLAEEPWLARTFGPEWEAYRRAAPRWFRWRTDRGRATPLEKTGGKG
jgi:protein-S-isoprenylcysteine O-methyltransferase Ste14